MRALTTTASVRILTQRITSNWAGVWRRKYRGSQELRQKQDEDRVWGQARESGKPLEEPYSDTSSRRWKNDPRKDLQNLQLSRLTASHAESQSFEGQTERQQLSFSHWQGVASLQAIGAKHWRFLRETTQNLSWVQSGQELDCLVQLGLSYLRSQTSEERNQSLGWRGHRNFWSEDRSFRATHGLHDSVVTGTHNTMQILRKYYFSKLAQSKQKILKVNSALSVDVNSCSPSPKEFIRKRETLITSSAHRNSFRKPDQTAYKLERPSKDFFTSGRAGQPLPRSCYSR